MPEWISYELQDFLLFSETTYWRIFERLNAAVWPFQTVTTAVFGATLCASLVWEWPRRLLLGLLALSWLGVALGFAPLYAEINWAMVHVVPAFWVQAVALGLLAIIAPIGAFAGARRRGDLCARTGVAITTASLVLWPLAAMLLRGSLGSAETVGIAPDPTAVATLGSLLAFGRGWGAACLCLLPLFWCGFSALTLVTMGASAEGLLLAAVLTTALLAVGARMALRRSSKG